MKTLQKQLIDSLVEDPSTISLAIEEGGCDTRGTPNYWPHLNARQQILAETIARLVQRSPNEIIDMALKEVLRAYKVVRGLERVRGRRKAIH
jgi:hypothetical protein